MANKIGVVGMGTMGVAFARNLESQGFSVAVYNRTYAKTEEFINKFGDGKFEGFEDIETFVASLEFPRKICLFVKSGEPVDIFIEKVSPFLLKGDIIIDCGNSFYKDTERRFDNLKSQNIRYVGCGVSGGEKGALEGPSMMFGGELETWKLLEPILESVAAKDFSGGACVSLVGEKGAGHFVKMVHNGIEYGIMQLIAEIYDLLRKKYKLEAGEISEIFEKLRHTKNASYLVDIASLVLKEKDGEGFLVNNIKDNAGSKGTGKWTVMEALDLGCDVSCIGAGFNSRIISTYNRGQGIDIAKASLGGNGITDGFFEKLENAFYLGILVNFIQGVDLISKSSREFDWGIDLKEVFRIWQGGCIIRAQILKELTSNLDGDGGDLLQGKFFSDVAENYLGDLSDLSSTAIFAGVPFSAHSSVLNYVLSIKSRKLPANLIQILRDYFGAHGFERLDKKGSFSHEWNRIY